MLDKLFSGSIFVGLLQIFVEADDVIIELLTGLSKRGHHHCKNRTGDSIGTFVANAVFDRMCYMTTDWWSPSVSAIVADNKAKSSGDIDFNSDRFVIPRRARRTLVTSL